MFPRSFANGLAATVFMLRCRLREIRKLRSETSKTTNCSICRRLVAGRWSLQAKNRRTAVSESGRQARAVRWLLLSAMILPGERTTAGRRQQDSFQAASHVTRYVCSAAQHACLYKSRSRTGLGNSDACGFGKSAATRQARSCLRCSTRRQSDLIRTSHGHAIPNNLPSVPWPVPWPCLMAQAPHSSSRLTHRAAHRLVPPKNPRAVRLPPPGRSKKTRPTSQFPSHSFLLFAHRFCCVKKKLYCRSSACALESKPSLEQFSV